MIPLTVHGWNEIVWTLVHSLWEGLAIAVLVSIALLLGRRQSATYRYSVLVTGLFLFLLAVAGTYFILLWNVPANPNGSPTETPDLLLTPILQSGSELAPGPGNSLISWLNAAASWVNRFAGSIGLVWLLLFAFQMLRLIRSMRYVQQIRTRQIHPAEGRWQELFHLLLRRTGISRRVGFMESGQVTVPMAIGFFKPMVLVPLGLLTQLPEDEVEAILLHELAHIRRHDYLVNIMQGFAESAFFFNPALLWLSARLREEREHCCDDLAIAHLNNREKFVRALLSFHEFRMQRQSAERLTMGLAGNRHQLLDRVKRILQKETKKVYAMEKSLFTLGIGALCIAGALFTSSFQSAKPDRAEKMPPAASPETAIRPTINQPAAVYDTVPSPANKVPADLELRQINVNTNGNDGELKRTITGVDKNGNKIRMVKENGKLTEVYQNDRAVPQSEWDPYRDMLDRIEEKIAAQEEMARRDQKRAHEMEAQARRYREMSDEQRKMEEYKMKQMHDEAMKLQMEQMSLRHRSQEIESQQKMMELERQLDKMNEELQDLNRVKEPTEEQKKAQAELELRMKDMKNELSDQHHRMARSDLDFQRDMVMQQEKMARLHQEQNEMLMKRELDRQSKENYREFRNMDMKARQDETIQRIIMPIVEDLKENDIIENPENLSFELTQKKFQVNGKTQSDAVLKQFASKYLNDPRDSIKFSNHDQSRNFSINLH